MLNLRSVATVARFEWVEAVHSRLALVVLLLYGATSSLFSYLFLKTLGALEKAARDTLSQTMGLDPSALPKDLVREKALPFLAQFVGDEGVKEQLLRMQPLAIFYGFLALNAVGLIVLATATGAIAGDVSSGASRFVLTRCDRLAWACGKFVGQAALMGSGLLIGALLTGVNGVWLEPDFAGVTWLWLLRTSFRAWIYGVAHLGLLLGLSLVARTPMRARANAIFLLFGMSLGHSVLDSDFAAAQFPFAKALVWLFPNHHKLALWSPEWEHYLPAVVCLVAIGVAGFLAGVAIFQRRDA